MVESLAIGLGGRLVSVQASATPPVAREPAPSPEALREQAAAAMAAAVAAEAAALDVERARMAVQREAMASAGAALTAATGQLAEFQNKLAREVETQLVELALTIARKVLMQEIKAGRYEIDPILKEALARIPARQAVVVRLNPDDLAHSEMARQAGAGAGPEGVKFVPDPAVRRAQCVLDMAEGVLESTIDQHLEEITRALGAGG
jgi:flagellar assembly protein FliH